MFNNKIAQIKYLSLFLLRVFCLLNISLIFLTQTSFAESKIPITTDSRIKTLVYNPNEVYQLKFHYGYQSYMEFGENESIEMISIGESFAWRLTPANNRLFIRPLEIAAHTNMTIITNLRTYQFDIRSGEYDGQADEELVYVIRFFYPEIRVIKPVPEQLNSAVPQQPNSSTSQKPSSPKPQFPTQGVGGAFIRSKATKQSINKPLTGMLKLSDNKNKINFDYQFAGQAPNITPIKVYDNNQETSFQFKNNNLIVPIISVVDSSGNESPLPYVNKDNYIVIPTVASQFTLRFEGALLCVFNNKAITGRKI